MGAVEFDLPWPPSVNRYYRHVGCRVLISREGRKYRMMVVGRLAGRLPKFEGGVALTAHCHPPDRRRRDLDNILKALQDALVHAGAMADDSQIRSLTLQMHQPQTEGCVHVQLASLPALGG